MAALDRAASDNTTAFSTGKQRENRIENTRTKSLRKTAIETNDLRDLDQSDLFSSETSTMRDAVSLCVPRLD